MSIWISNRQFEFCGSDYDLTSSVQQILNHIGDHIPQRAKTDDIFFRYKIIITELLTNAIKHSGSGCTLIDITIGENGLFINKTDRGEKFDLLSAADIDIEQIKGYKKSITADPIHLLYAVWDDKNKVHFQCEENNMDDPWDINDMMEHFGLLIITKSSNEFSYTYDEHSLTNAFSVKLEF